MHEIEKKLAIKTVKVINLINNNKHNKQKTELYSTVTT